MCDFTIREAADGDIPAILAINTGDEDYLPDYLSYYMKQPNHTCVVMEMAHGVVGFVVMSIVDAGVTAILKAGRVSEGLRHLRIGKHMERHCLLLANSKGCKRKVISVETTNPFLTSGRLQSSTEVCRKPYQITVVHAGVILPAPESDTTLTSVSDQTLAEYISNTHMRRYLFPCNTIYVDNIAYRALTANIPLLRGRKTTFYSDISFKTQRKAMPGVMSAGTPWRYRTGSPAYTVDLFGANISSIERHISMHIKQCSTIFANGSVSLCIQYENDSMIARAIQRIVTRLSCRLNEGCAVVLENNLVPYCRY